MKNLKLLFFVLPLICISIACATETNDQNEQKEDPAVEQTEVSVYYFHFERRCATCKAVESVSKEAISDLYGDKVKFNALNLDDEEGKKTAERLGVSGQALLVIQGNKRTDLTTDAFMNAVNKPEELKNKLEKTIDPLAL